MKKLIILFSALIAVAGAEAQMKEGTIVYEQKTNMHRMIPDEQMKAFMPEFRTSKHQLIFANNTSMYKTLPEDERPTEGGGGVVMRMGGGSAERYCDFNTFKLVESADFFGKAFLIIDSIKSKPWKITEETKQILGHTCRKAIMKTKGMRAMRFTMTSSQSNSSDTIKKSGENNVPAKEIEIIAWFADDILAPVGPETYNQLPGAILELDVDNAQSVYTAVEIKDKYNPKELKEPKKGKVVTREEYQKEVQEGMKNMQMGGGGIRIGG